MRPTDRKLSETIRASQRFKTAYNLAGPAELEGIVWNILRDYRWIPAEEFEQKHRRICWYIRSHFANKGVQTKQSKAQHIRDEAGRRRQRENLSRQEELFT
jgi:hypothetical protein